MEQPSSHLRWGKVGDYAFAGCATEATVNGYIVYPFYVKKAGMSDTEKDGYAEYAVVEEDKSSTKTVYIAENDRISSLDYAGLSETEQLQYTKVLAVAVRCYYKAADAVENSVSGTTYKVADEYLDTTTDAYKTYYYRQESTQPTLRLKSGTTLEKEQRQQYGKPDVHVDYFHTGTAEFDSRQRHICLWFTEGDPSGFCGCKRNRRPRV